MKNKIFLLYCLLLGQNIVSAPKTVLIIRHGEKIITKHEVIKKGLETTLKKGLYEYKYDLSLRGEERAAALAHFLKYDTSITQYETPIAIFASFASAGKWKSNRPLDTIQPFAKAIEQQVIINYSPNQYKELVQHIMTNSKFDNKTIMISFEHKHIPLLAQEFQNYHKNNKSSKRVFVPKKWKGTTFDRVWVLEFKSDESLINFQNIPQRLLFGDSKQ